MYEETMITWYQIEGLDECFNNRCLNLVSLTSNPNTTP